MFQHRNKVLKEISFLLLLIKSTPFNVDVVCIKISVTFSVSSDTKNAIYFFHFLLTQYFLLKRNESKILYI